MIEDRELFLEEFIAQEKEILDAFEANWRLNNESRPAQWPLKEEPGFWDEQFRVFHDHADPAMDSAPIPSERS